MPRGSRLDVPGTLHHVIAGEIVRYLGLTASCINRTVGEGEIRMKGETILRGISGSKAMRFLHHRPLTLTPTLQNETRTKIAKALEDVVDDLIK